MRLKATEGALAIVLGLALSCTHPESSGGSPGTGRTGDNTTTGAAGGAGSASATGAGGSAVSTTTSGTGGSATGGNSSTTGGGSDLAGAGGNRPAAGTGGGAGSSNGASGGNDGAGASAAAGTSGLAGSAGTKGESAGADAGATGGAGGSVIPGEKKANVVAPASTSVPSDYFVMGETRLINNNWGAQSLGCKAPYQIFVNADKTFGWKWDRASVTCGGNKSKPDYPEVEFGIHPFGLSKQLVTTPDYSSTTVLPIQVKDVKTASVTIDGLSLSGPDKSWNMNFEMWFDDQNPVTGTHTTAYGETMNWFGWSSDQYNWNGVVGTLDTGAQKWNLYLSRDAWPDGQAQQWKYRQWRAQTSSNTFSGTVDIKKILDHLTGSENWPTSLWIARFEVGTELDDGSSGTVTIKKITFEVNGQTRETEIH